MNNNMVKIATIGVSGISILVFLIITNQFNQSGNSGSMSLIMPGVKLQHVSDDINVEQILSDKQRFHANKAIAKRIFGLYELDHELLSAMDKLDYQSDFSIELRKLQERMRGPFFAPDVKVELAFSDQIGISRARVCADSMFLNQSLTIATEDGDSMDMIESANELLLHECPAHQREVEKIIVAEQFGVRLLGTEKPPASVQVIAKAIPTIRFIHPPQNEIKQ